MSELEDKTGPHRSDGEPNQTESHAPPSPAAEQYVPNEGQAQPGQSKEYADPPVNQGAGFFQRYRPSAQTVWNFLVTVFTGLLTLITYWQYQLGESALEVSRLDQRAWVVPNGMSGPTEVKEGVSLAFGVQVVNSGKTPALNLRALVGGHAWYRGQSFVPTYERDPLRERSIGTLLPTSPIMVPAKPIVLSQKQLSALRDEVTVLYIYGELSYDDVFNNPHCTAFCFALLPTLQGARACEEHTKVTDTKCENIR